MIKFLSLFLLSVSSFTVHASNVISGSFEATKSCPAYLSKSKKTNPDNLMTRVNERYQLKEINQIPPDWVRIEFPNNQRAMRWVRSHCGVAEYTESSTDRCNTNVGMADSYVLAMSSQAGFCETYGYEIGKPECMKLSKKSYQASHLTLHGLWPNQNACGQHYGFCEAQPRSNHCDYSPIHFTATVAENLKKLMPSYNYGSCLERHEWNKHGTCQVLNADEYFTLAMRLTTETDQSILGQYLTQHKGEQVKLSYLRQLIVQAFGKNNSGKVYLGCKNNTLVDVFIQLPAQISDEPIETLINNAPDFTYRDTCPASVKISNFNKDFW